MKYYKNMEFLKPYIESAKDLFPYKKFDVLKGYRVKKGKSEQTEGSIHMEDNGRFTISLLTASYYPQEKKYKNKTLHFILDTLAHELAHAAEWEHTPRHYEIQSKVSLRFSKVLRKLKVKDSSLRIRFKT